MNKYQEALNYFLYRDEGENVTVTCDWLGYAEDLTELIGGGGSFLSDNQIMILNLIAIREKEKSRYYYIKDSLRPQEYESVTNTYLADMDWISEKLKYYRGKEKVERRQKTKD